MIKLTEEDKLKIIRNKPTTKLNRVKKLDLDCGPCYAKFCDNTGAFRELFGKKIFDIVGIASADYTFYKEENCVISSDLVKEYKNFKQTTSLGEVNNLGQLHKIAMQFNNYDELCIQINIMHFIDMLFGNVDRHTDNYGFSIDEKNNAKLVVLDNELMLHDYYHAKRPVSFPTTSPLAFVTYSHESEMNFFIHNLSEHQQNLMMHYLKTFNMKNVYMIMRSIERNNKCKFKEKNTLLKNYMKNYMRVYRIMIESKHAKKELK